jgi:antitoxin component YwqK of YwqJK toxin-antitoxin module
MRNYILENIYSKESSEMKNFKISKKHKYFKNGFVHGIYKSWYNTGELFAIIEYKGDQMCEHKEYYKNGKLQFRTNYNNGFSNRTEYHYHNNGNKASIIYFKDGKAIMTKKYDKDGKRLFQFY